MVVGSFFLFFLLFHMSLLTRLSVPVLALTALLVAPLTTHAELDGVSVTVSDDRDTVQINEPFTVRVVLRNDRDQELKDAAVVVAIPRYFIPTAQTPEGAADPQARTITWAAQTLPPRTEATFSYTGHTEPGTPNASVLKTEVEVKAEGQSVKSTDSTTVQTVAVVSPAARDVQTTAPTGSPAFLSGLALIAAGSLGSFFFVTRRP